MGEKIYWIDNDSNTIDLTDGVKYNVLYGVDGRHMPPFTYTTKKVWGYPGKVVSNVSTDEREVTLPLFVQGTSYDNLMTNVRALEAAFNPMNGPGQLQFSLCSPASAFRSLTNCYYTGGMSFPETQDTLGTWWKKFSVTFTGYYPYYLDTDNPVNTVWDNANIDTHYTITNPGDTNAWPEIYINGKFTQVGVVNNTNTTYCSMQGLEVDSPHYLYWNTRPHERACCVDKICGTHDGPPVTHGNVFTHMDPVYNLVFPLTPGANDISFNFIGDDANTHASVYFYPEYLGI